LRSKPVFDPVSILLAVKSGPDPSAYTVLRPDLAYFTRERFGNNLGRVGAIVVAVVCAVGWFLLIANSGAVAFFFPDPLARAGVYLFESSIAIAGLAAAFVILPRSLERQSRSALILTPDGLILADWEQSEVIRAIDYRATDKLTLKVVTVDEAPDLYNRLIMTEHDKTRRWTIEEYFEVYPAEIAWRVMRDYARAKERG
jgi:hypothetical protein